MNAPANFPTAAELDARDEWLLNELGKCVELLKKLPQDADHNLRFAELVQAFTDADMSDHIASWRCEIGRYGIDRDGYALTCQGEIDHSAPERRYIPLAEEYAALLARRAPA